MDYAEISKTTFDLLFQSRSSLSASPLEENVRILVELRVSQITGCAYCCSMHAEEARRIGISQEKLDVLTAWRNTVEFTEEEQIALEWAEAVTYLDNDLLDLKERLYEFYSEREIVDLTACIGIMNALSRVAISLRDDH